LAYGIPVVSLCAECAGLAFAEELEGFLVSTELFARMEAVPELYSRKAAPTVFPLPAFPGRSLMGSGGRGAVAERVCCGCDTG